MYEYSYLGTINYYLSKSVLAPFQRHQRWTPKMRQKKLPIRASTLSIYKYLINRLPHRLSTNAAKDYQGYYSYVRTTGWNCALVPAQVGRIGGPSRREGLGDPGGGMGLGGRKSLIMLLAFLGCLGCLGCIGCLETGV